MFILKFNQKSFNWNRKICLAFITSKNVSLRVANLKFFLISNTNVPMLYPVELPWATINIQWWVYGNSTFLNASKTVWFAPCACLCFLYITIWGETRINNPIVYISFYGGSAISIPKSYEFVNKKRMNKKLTIGRRIVFLLLLRPLGPTRARKSVKIKPDENIIFYAQLISTVMRITIVFCRVRCYGV